MDYLHIQADNPCYNYYLETFVNSLDIDRGSSVLSDLDANYLTLNHEIFF